MEREFLSYNEEMTYLLHEILKEIKTLNNSKTYQINVINQSNMSDKELAEKIIVKLQKRFEL